MLVELLGSFNTTSKGKDLIHMGKVTPNLDVFSFTDLLFKWVWELYNKERLLNAAAPKLGKAYDVEEMEKVLKLGLVCSHTDPKSRLGMHYDFQILEGEDPLPNPFSILISVASLPCQSLIGGINHVDH